jgi:hypothetical protein
MDMFIDSRGGGRYGVESRLKYRTLYPASDGALA